MKRPQGESITHRSSRRTIRLGRTQGQRSGWSRREQDLGDAPLCHSSFRSCESFKIFFILLKENPSCVMACMQVLVCVWCYVVCRSQRTASSVGPHHPPCFERVPRHCSLRCAPGWLVLNLQGFSSIYTHLAVGTLEVEMHTPGHANSGPTLTQQALSQSHLPSCPLPLTSVVNKVLR